MELAHKCHAEGCDVNTPPRMLMCRKHWFMVPAHVRDWVWRHYRPGQEIMKDPGAEYLRVMRMAIDAVAAEEARRAE